MNLEAPMPDDVAQIVKSLQALCEWIDHYPLPQEVRERMTYTEFHHLLQAKKAELGLDYITIFAEHGEDEDVCAWIEQAGMSLDHRELMPENHHFDLPLNFFMMPEYKTMLDAEEEYWQRAGKTPYVALDDSELMDIVRKHAPNLRHH